jgi:hypothetical protein
LSAGDVSVGRCIDGTILAVHESLQENIEDEIDTNDDLPDSRCSGLFVCLAGGGPDPTGMVLIQGSSGYRSPERR